MEKVVVRTEIIERIKSDQVLFGKVAKAANLSIRRMVDVINEERTRERLATGTVLKVLRGHLSLKDKQLTEELQEC